MNAQKNPWLLILAVAAGYVAYTGKLPSLPNNNPTPTPAPNVVPAWNNDARVAAAFPPARIDAMAYATYYDAMADWLESGAGNFPRASVLAERVRKARGLADNADLEVIVKETLAPFKNKPDPAQWTDADKAAAVAAFRQLSSACLKAVK